MTFRPFLRLRFPRVFGRFGLGFRWCLAFSHPLPTKSIYVFVQARLCDGCSPTSAVISLSLEGPKGELAGFLTTQLVLGHVFPAACRFAMLEAIFSFSFLWVLRQRFGLFCACGFVAFLVVLGSDLGGVWPFRIHCRRDPVLSLSRLGCGTVFVHRLQPLTWFYKISKVLFRNVAVSSTLGTITSKLHQASKIITSTETQSVIPFFFFLQVFSNPAFLNGMVQSP